MTVPRSFALVAAWAALAALAGRVAQGARDSGFHYRPPYRFADASAEPTPRIDWRAILVVVDGLRLDQSRKLRGLDRFRIQGADLSCTTGIPSFSRPGRANLVTGAPPELHGATTNLHQAALPIDNLFRRVTVAGGGVAIAGSELWRSLFREDLAQATVTESPVKEVKGAFARVAPEMIRFEWQALRSLLQHKPRLAVMDLVAPDYAAHEHGARSPEYSRACIEADRVLAALADEVDLFRTLVVVTGDHGHLDGGGHGGGEPEVVTVPLVMAGRGVRAGTTGQVRQIDVAPTIAALLGLPIPGGSEGRVLFELLELDEEQERALAEAQRRQKAAFLRDFARALGEAPPPAASLDTTSAAPLAAARRLDLAVEAVRQIKLGKEQRARLPVVLGLVLLPLVAFVALHRRELGRSLLAAVAGGALYTLAFRALVRLQGIRVSLSGIQHEEDLEPFFLSMLLLSALAAVATVAAAVTPRSGDRLGAGFSALAGAGYVLVAEVALVHWRQWLAMEWRVGDIDEGFGAAVELFRLQAVGYAAVAVPLLAWLARRRDRGRSRP